MGKLNFLDTKGACFLCLNDNFTPREVARMPEVSLRNICRYLNIDQRCVLRKACQKPVYIFEEFGEKPCDFSVKLCAPCSSLTNNLSDLISQINTIKILMTNQLQTFLDLIKFPSHHPGNVKRSNKRPPKSLLPFQLEEPTKMKTVSSAVETLRVEATQKCAAKVESLMSTCFPAVRLHKLSDEDIQRLCKKTLEDKQEVCVPPTESGPERPTTLNISSPPSSQSLDMPPILTPHYSPVLDNIQENVISNSRATPSPPDSSHADPSPPPPPKPAISEHKLVYKICERKFTETEDGYNCHICDLTIPRGAALRIPKHIINCHPELLFPKPYNLSKEMFQDHCRRFLFHGVSLARGGDQQTPAGATVAHRSRLTCEFCSKCFKGDKDFKYHLITYHYSDVQRKLYEFDGSTHEETLHHKESQPVETLQIKESQPVKSPEGENPVKTPSSSKRIKKMVWRCTAGEGGSGCGKPFLTYLRFVQHKKNCDSGRNETIWKQQLLAEEQKVGNSIGLGGDQTLRLFQT